MALCAILVDVDIDYRMVPLCREARGWTQSALAKATGFSQGYISKVESGLVEVPDERVKVLADALDCPVSLLGRPFPEASGSVTCIHHRRRASTMLASTRLRMNALANLTAITVQALGPVSGSTTTLMRVRRDESRGPRDVAQEIRRFLGLGSEPIRELTPLLEGLGVTVVRRSLGTTHQDAMSLWPALATPVIVVNTGVPTDRLRFTMAHELGHLLLHPAPSEGQEAEADEFASELMAPAAGIAGDLEDLSPRDFNRMLELKAKWGISIAAIAHRARDLGVFSPDEYRNVNIRLNQLGWKRVEPGVQGVEPEPWFMSRCRAMVAGSGGLEATASLALMLPTTFARTYLPAATEVLEAS